MMKRWDQNDRSEFEFKSKRRSKENSNNKSNNLSDTLVGRNFIFFFSSRRRHTRFDCDWSSDVCSSDLSKVPAIALTAFASENDHKMALATGFHAHLAKPVEPDHLIEIIRRVVRGNF